jgi:two-component system, OmpR family, sensor kinase
VKLRTRLAVAAAIFAAILTVIGFLLPRTVRAAELRQVDSQLASAFPVIAAQYPTPRGAPPQPAPDRPPSSTSFSDLYVADVDTDGSRTEFIASRLAIDRAPRFPTIPTSANGPNPQFATVRSVSGGGSWRVAVVTPRDRRTKLLVGLPLDRVEETTSKLRWFLLAAAASVLATLGLAAWWIVRLGLRPIAEVTSVADAIASGERDRRANESNPRTEAGSLAHSLNSMLDERHAAEDRLRRFVADASHELRTPIAAIRGFADLRRAGGLTDEESVDQAMRRIGQESHRMGDLVDDMLLLASLDQRRPLHLTVVDVVAIAVDAKVDAAVTHPLRTVSVVVPATLTAKADEARLRQVVSNLVSNALSHAGADAVTTIAAHQGEAGICVIEVSDDGCGMDTETAAHAFDRFWRGDPSRVRRRGGAGLGLSIVSAIVDAHGGTISLHTGRGLGTRVRVVLPNRA